MRPISPLQDHTLEILTEINGNIYEKSYIAIILTASLYSECTQRWPTLKIIISFSVNKLQFSFVCLSIILSTPLPPTPQNPFLWGNRKNDMGHTTCDAWHLTHDRWHMTCDIWHMTCDMLWGVNILSKFQLPSCYGLWFIISWTLGGKGSRTDWLINDKGVCRTAPAKPGLLNTLQKIWT